MRIGMTGTVTKLAMASLGLVLALALGACTTVEGTNAMTDIGTFEREVMIPTARGVGLVPGDAPKQDLTQARAPLVLPRSAGALPPPSTQAAAAQLPANSDTVQIDASNLSEADIQRLRNAKVVDLRSLSGRPLTDAEARTLQARMQAANMSVAVDGQRPLYLPPDEYFTRVGNADLVCSTPSGEIVSVNDPKCPPQVRASLQRISNASQPTSSGPLGSSDARLSNSEITNN